MFAFITWTHSCFYFCLRNISVTFGSIESFLKIDNAVFICAYLRITYMIMPNQSNCIYQSSVFTIGYTFIKLPCFIVNFVIADNPYSIQ